ncbi:cupin domain-containing protein [Cystobacter ferrugineus]|uniref:cupin domain-containing protein n=1 Tax=Cystobacter ferrugineus TaxID=83449 RepID=UPI001650EBDC|nr:cupin domain-containing protein [Cystobacter ferrugineus]
MKVPDLSALEYILHPMPVEVFLNEYWEKKVLHISRNQPDYYKRLFTLRDLDAFLGHTLTNDEVRSAKEGKVIYPRVEGESKTTLYQFYELYRTGYTPVVRNIHLFWEPIGEIANELALAFGCFISTHMYATPENSQGFSSHWDDHDIFALQLEGEKEWRLYDTGPTLPRYSQDRNDYQRQHPTLGQASQIIDLKAGDLLYFPRGVIHEPRTRTCSSLHLTYGLYPDAWEHLVTESIHELAEKEPLLQEGLPFGFSKNAAAGEALQPRAAEMAARVIQEARFEESRSRLAARVLGRIAPLADGHFGRLDDVAKVDLETRLEKRKSMVGVVLPQGAGVKLHYPGGTYTASAALAPALHFMTRQDGFCVRDIPGQASERERLDLVRELIQVGFLKVADPRNAR